MVATMRNPDAASTELRALCDVQPLDVTNDISTEKLSRYLASKYDGCDVLINNAGYGCLGTLETVPIKFAKDSFEVNVWGVMRVSKMVVPFMRKRGGGLIVTVSSTSGWRGLPCFDIYVGSKHAIEGMMDSFRYSLQKDNIKVCMANPGPVSTPFTARALAERVMVKAWGRASPSEDTGKGLGEALTDHYVGVNERRLSSGQSPEDCAKEIAAIVGRELGKRIDGDSTERERATFWNPTSDYAREVLREARRSQDGSTGPVYDPWWESSFRALESLQKHTDD